MGRCGPGREPVSSRRFRIAAAAAVAACSLLAAACTAGGARGTGGTAAVNGCAPASAGGSVPAAGRPAMALQLMPAPYQLPAAVSHAVALSAGPGLLIAGGLTADGAPSRPATWLDPVTGASHAATAGRAALQAAAAVLGGAGSVTAGSARYLVGAAGGARPDPRVLAVAGGRLRAAARLPVPVRYAAAAAASGAVWVFGGQAATGATDVIQRVDPATGAAAVAGHLPRPLYGAAALSLGGQVYLAGGIAGGTAAGGTAGRASGAVYRFDPATCRVTAAGRLAVPVSYAAAAVSGDVGYLIGGQVGGRPVPAVSTLRLVAAGRVVPPPGAPWLAPATGPGRLAPGSDPSALPGDVLIADHENNRLLIVDPQGRIRWEFPRPGGLAPGQTFLAPDDAFFSPDGRYIIATQEDQDVISVISVAAGRIVYRYGTPGVPGSGPGQLSHPDDAMLTPGGAIVSADIKNCRILLITPPAHAPSRVIGETTQGCVHGPPRRFGSPNGVFPLTDGRYLVTEINGDWADEMSLAGAVAWSAHPPGVLYPSDSNEVYPGRYLTADYSDPGQVVEFDSRGRLLWRHGGFNHPSLALPLPNGDILLNDDFNDRVCVLDPATGRIVWQYGHTGVPGRGPGYLDDPDGVDLAPPDSLLITHAATMGS
jgi:outer membrane protein assembly factor BamB